MKNFTLLFLTIVLLSALNNYVKSQDVAEKFDPTHVNVSQHQIHEQSYAHLNYTHESEWDSVQGIVHKSGAMKDYKLKKDFRTFGWHLYSNGSAHKSYNYSLLWGLAYFSYAVDPETGSYKSIHGWKTTELIDSAKVYGTKVFLTVTNFGANDNSVFLENPIAQNNLIDSLISLLAFRKADGINIDFEGVASKNKQQFSDFIVKISKRIKTINPDYMVSICLYAIDWNDIFDIKTIDPFIDFYTLMGYDYFGNFSKETGPVSPLGTTSKFGRGLVWSVNYYLNKGIASKRLIVGLPYYGAEWNIDSPTKQAGVVKFRVNPPYRVIKQKAIVELKQNVCFDKECTSSYITIDSGVLRQVWFDDVKSLSLKYDWIINEDLGGVGIWALGYDHGYPELWELLAKKFATE